jgi:mono/diheme cytochrome c family protein
MRAHVSSSASSSRPSLSALVLLVGLSLAAACGHGPTPDAHAKGFDNSPSAAVDPAAEKVARGKYLVNSVGGCNDCHTPMKMGPKGPEPDMERYLSGHPEGLAVGPAPALRDGWLYAGNLTNTAFAGPWGVSYAVNLTSDPDRGVGAVTEEVFVRTIRTGKHLGVGRPIMPPMPWPVYAQMTDDDLKAILAYLKTVPASRNRVPEAVVAAPPTAKTN